MLYERDTNRNVINFFFLSYKKNPIFPPCCLFTRKMKVLWIWEHSEDEQKAMFKQLKHLLIEIWLAESGRDFYSVQ